MIRGLLPTLDPCPRCAAPLALCLCLLAACAPEPAADGPPLVLVSVLPQQYFAERIAGELARVEVMIPPGASPASHEPRMTDLKALARAKLYIKVGHPHFPFEQAWLDRLLADANGLAVVDSCEGLEVEEDDPHVWLSPRHAQQVARHIHAGLVGALPDQREALDANLASLLDEIEVVDAELRARFADRAGATFLVFHPAWHYFAHEYGLVQMAIEQDHKHPDPRQLARTVAQAQALGIDVVFAQPHFDPSSARTVAGELGGRVETLDPLAYDWPANLRSAGERIDAAARP